MRKSSFCLLTVVAISLFSHLASAQTVLNRIRIGGYSEGTAYVSAGPLAGYTVLLRGAEVVGYPDILTSKKGPKVLFNIVGLPLKDQPRGIAYIPPARKFVFADNGQPDRLILSTESGQPAGIIYLNFPDTIDFRPNRFEGMTYIPATADSFPNHLAISASWEPSLAGQQGTPEKRILFVSLYGYVAASVIPQYPEITDVNHPDGLYPYEIGGIAYQKDNVLVCGEQSVIWKLNFAGESTGAANSIPGDAWFEGVTVLPDGNIVATDGYRKVWAFDANLNRLAGSDRDVTVGLGINPRAVAWNNDTGEFLLTEVNVGDDALWSVPAAFGAKQKLADLGSITISEDYLVEGETADLASNRMYGLAYRGDTHEIALNYATPSNVPGVPVRTRIVTFNNSGDLTGYLRLQDWNATQMFGAGQLSYALQGGEGTYVLRGSTPDLNKLKLASTGGNLSDIIDLVPAEVNGINAVEYFNRTPSDSGGGRFLVFTSGYRALVTNSDGDTLSEFNYREKLGTLTPGDLAYIGTGPYAGAFATIANSGNEIVIFRLGQ